MNVLPVGRHIARKFNIKQLHIKRLRIKQFHIKQFHIKHSCTLCGADADQTHALCTGCQGDLPWIESGCIGCGLPLPSANEQSLCGECIQQPHIFDQVCIPFTYHSPIRQLITQLKHHHQLQLSPILGQLLIAALLDHYCDQPLPEIIIPVPLHWRRLSERGFNQSQELARQVSRTLHIPQRHGLIRRRDTAQQQQLDRQQRMANLRGAFRARPAIAGRRVALLDDVVTTGATAMETGRQLRLAGAREVHLWALARTPAPST